LPTRSRSSLFLFRELVKRDFRGRYAGSFLGFLWSFVQPLWQLLLFSFVFASVMKVTPTGEHTDSFAAFLFAGLLPWLALSEGLVRSVTVITDNANLVKKLTFPSEVLVFSTVLAAVLHEAIAAAVFLVTLALTGNLSLRGLPFLIVALPLQASLTLGLGFLLAAIQVFVRDAAQLVGLVLSGWFYLTPIVYPLAYVPERLRRVIELNPLTGLVSLYRRAFLGGGEVAAVPLASLVLTATVTLGLGWWLFRRLKATFVDEI
jgi:homopolymeric O-antigen transport system permease protein